MLIYHPIHDINHCLFRMLLILEKTCHDEIQWDLFRLMDFYLLFPSQVREIKPIPRALSSYRKMINDIPDEYEIITNPKRLFFDLLGIQTPAALNLVGKEYLCLKKFGEGIVKRTEAPLPEKLILEMEGCNLVKKDWFDLVVNQLPLVEFLGKSGIKDRSSLLEYKYDIKDEVV